MDAQIPLKVSKPNKQTNKKDKYRPLQFETYSAMLHLALPTPYPLLSSFSSLLLRLVLKKILQPNPTHIAV